MDSIHPLRCFMQLSQCCTSNDNSELIRPEFKHHIAARSDLAYIINARKRHCAGLIADVDNPAWKVCRVVSLAGLPK